MLWLDDKRCHKDFETFPTPKLLKTHCPVSLAPESAFTNKSKIILAIRNPKDVAISFYHFYKNKNLGSFSGSFDEFADMFSSGYFHFGSWTKHTAEWWQKARESDNILPVFYEDNKEDPHNTVRKIADFLGKQLTTEQVDTIVNYTSFSKMQSRPSSNLEHVASLSQKFIRNGKIGDWRNYFSDAQSDRFDGWLDEGIKDAQLKQNLKF